MQTEVSVSKKKRAKVSAALKIKESQQINTEAVIQFFKDSLSLSDTGLAAELGVEDRSIRLWRSKPWEEICAGRKSNRLFGFYQFVILCTQNNVATDSIIKIYRASLNTVSKESLRDYVLEQCDSPFFKPVVELAIKNYLRELNAEKAETLEISDISFEDLITRVMKQTNPNAKLIAAFKKYGKPSRSRK